jgi:hypothetical protein
MRWTVHVACVGEIRNVGLGSMKGKNVLEELYIDGRTILLWILKLLGGRMKTIGLA